MSKISGPKILFAELVLVLASVFVFRGLWMLLDRVEIMSEPAALVLSLVLGAVATLWALHFLIRSKGL
jgi:uncharacterized membrane protein YqjE